MRPGSPRLRLSALPWQFSRSEEPRLPLLNNDLPNPTPALANNFQGCSGFILPKRLFLSVGPAEEAARQKPMSGGPRTASTSA